MEDDRVQLIIKFVSRCRLYEYDLESLMRLMIGWDVLYKDEKEQTIRYFKEGKGQVAEYFQKLLDEEKDFIKFDIDTFQKLYEQWAELKTLERETAYGMFYKCGNRRYTGKKYKNSEKEIYQFELFNEDIDKRNEYAKPSGVYKFRCRDCAIQFYANYNTLFCTNCGSINIYSPQNTLVYNVRDWSKMPKPEFPKRRK